MKKNYGPIALLGSGETSLAGGRIFEALAARLPSPLHVCVMETPAGFELNSAQVAGKVAEYLRIRLQNFNPQVEIVPARKRNTPFSPDDPVILEPLLRADLIFMGAGSPTYAVQQLRGSLAWDLLRARHRQGAALVFASAAAIAVGVRTIPVYEIYKVGEEISCPDGLNLFSDLGLCLSCVPHWNNTEGGDDLDTSRCYIGMDRFSAWCSLLPSGHTTLGLDEHTGILIDFSGGTCTISGVSSVTLLRQCNPQIFPAGSTFPISELGDARYPDDPFSGLSEHARQMITSYVPPKRSFEPPGEVVRLMKLREEARNNDDWAGSDSLRQKIIALGWTVQDTKDGQKVFEL